MGQDNTNTIFLLGGYDLEMLEIRKLLSSMNYRFIDQQLNWGNAILSQYAEYFNDTNNFVGIELRSDINPPLHYQLIDHHNENIHLPSSIEQVANLIGIELSKEQKLIAANDKGYIPAMKALGATDDEITDIRRRDRAAQGVTEEDERLAEISISENLSLINGITIVKSQTNRFSTITDRLYPKKSLLIYTDFELTYYGAGVTYLAETFNNLLKNKCAYSGGGENGFFGITREAISQGEDLKMIIDKIIHIISYGKITL